MKYSQRKVQRVTKYYLRKQESDALFLDMVFRILNERTSMYIVLERELRTGWKTCEKTIRLDLHITIRKS